MAFSLKAKKLFVDLISSFLSSGNNFRENFDVFFSFEVFQISPNCIEKPLMENALQKSLVFHPPSFFENFNVSKRETKLKELNTQNLSWEAFPLKGFSVETFFDGKAILVRVFPILVRKTVLLKVRVIETQNFVLFFITDFFVAGYFRLIISRKTYKNY